MEGHRELLLSWMRLLAATVVIATSILGWRRMARNGGRVATEPWTTVADWRTYANVPSTVGERRGEVHLVVFSDYECPACASLNQRLASWRARHPGLLSYAVRQLPLSERSGESAVAAGCAARQGSFARFHDSLFAQRDSLHRRSYEEIAIGVGIGDTATFRRCLASQEAKAWVDADVAAAERAGVARTPTLLIDGEMYVGDVWDLDRLLGEHLAGK